MSRLCVICEGKTEQFFVQELLVPHFLDIGIFIAPSLVKTRSGKQGGGSVTVERLARHIRNEYSNFEYLTTFVDLYGFQDSRGRDKQTLERDILDLAREEVGINCCDTRKIIPYVQQYEFEGLLFSNVQSFEWVIDAWDARAKQELIDIRQQFDSPEDINNSRETAPSKRISQVFGGFYSKTEHGPLIAGDIGLLGIRDECKGFNDWLTTLELLGA